VRTKGCKLDSKVEYAVSKLFDSMQCL